MLARRVRDSPTLREEWNKKVGALKKGDMLDGDRSQLTTLVPTRWDSEGDCLEAHIHFKVAVNQITESNQTLRAYKLTSLQWDLAEELLIGLGVSIYIIMSGWHCLTCHEM